MKHVALFIFVLLQAGFASAENLRVLMVSPEQSVILQTGGLAHATTGLARSLNREGVKTDVLMPWYTEMNAPPTQATGQKLRVPGDFQGDRAGKVSEFSVLTDGGANGANIFLKHESQTLESNFFDNRSFGSHKKTYGADAVQGEAFATWAKATADYILSQNYDVIVLNDWTTGLVALHIAEAKKAGKKVPKVVFAIHNIAYQGTFPKTLADKMGLDPKYMGHDGYEFWGQMNMLKAGLEFADMIYTVSARYAQEIATPRFGAGLDGLIRYKAMQGRVAGILNGMLNEEWDPTRKTAEMPYVFAEKNFLGKTLGKKSLQQELGLPVSKDVPMFVLTSRLAEQKGFEYMIQAMDAVAQSSNAQFVVIGDGDPKYIEPLKELVRRYPDRVRYQKFSNVMEKKLTRYGDFFVNGAWFEPSGLNQLFALRNGTIPIVSRAGGLADSVVQNETGLLFDIVPGAGNEPYDKEATMKNAVQALESGVKLFQNKKKFREMRRSAMAQKNSWASRIHTEFMPMFEYVLKNGPLHIRGSKMWPREGKKASELLAAAGMSLPVRGGAMCSAIFAR